MFGKKVVEIIRELNSLIYERYEDFRGCYLCSVKAGEDFWVKKEIHLIALFDETDREKELELYSIICNLERNYNVFILLNTYTTESLMQDPDYQNEIINSGSFYGVAA